MPIYSSDSEDEFQPPVKLFGRRRPIRDALGGGKVADVLLWKDWKVSGGLLMGMSVIWFLFEVVEYNFVTLFSHASITALLVFFIWSRGAQFINWRAPELPKSLWDKTSFQQLASTFHSKFNQALLILLDIASGRDPALFILAISGLYILSIVGNYFTFLNFLYFGYICLQVVPFLYEKYEDQVDYFASNLIRQIKTAYRKFDSNVLNKIPRGPVKEKKAI